MAPLLFQELKEDYVRCQACLRRCTVAPEKNGICGNRINRKWPAWARYKLEDKVTNNIFVLDTTSTLGDKPILYLPDGKGDFVSSDTPVVSVGGLGCNLDCKECPNPSMSHPEEVKIYGHYSPGLVVSFAKRKGFKYIAITYNEPVPFPETCMELTQKAREAGIETILVTNTTFTPEFIQAYYNHGGRIARLDLKATIPQINQFYSSYCGLNIKEAGHVVTDKRILESIKAAKDMGLHIEIMTAVTPRSYKLKNVGCASWEIPLTVDWIKENLGKETPWHLTTLIPKGGLDESKRALEMQRISSYTDLARKQGLLYVNVYKKMCDCKDEEPFKSGDRKSCC